MRTVRLQDLGELAAEYVGAAEAGETVSVTVGGRVVAEIVPPRPPETALSERLSRGESEGWYTPPEVGRVPSPLARGSAPADDPDISLEQLMQELAEDRADR